MTLKDTVQTIESAEGWVFAFEGGAHVLFRYTKVPSKFVLHGGYFSRLILGREATATRKEEHPYSSNVEGISCTTRYVLAIT
jgi:hypothetical protein